mmetsp:Transcript_3758/g.8484  ORF Transcript_3758/g.8484 Transcript_3758/m.8484 type:complete len:359 (-) Transcript_3758:137-1213(-)
MPAPRSLSRTGGNTRSLAETCLRIDLGDMLPGDACALLVPCSSSTTIVTGASAPARLVPSINSTFVFFTCSTCSTCCTLSSRAVWLCVWIVLTAIRGILAKILNVRSAPCTASTGSFWVPAPCTVIDSETACVVTVVSVLLVTEPTLLTSRGYAGDIGSVDCFASPRKAKQGAEKVGLLSSSPPIDSPFRERSATALSTVPAFSSSEASEACPILARSLASSFGSMSLLLSLSPLLLSPPLSSQPSFKPAMRCDCGSAAASSSSDLTSAFDALIESGRKPLNPADDTSPFKMLGTICSPALSSRFEPRDILGAVKIPGAFVGCRLSRPGALFFSSQPSKDRLLKRSTCPCTTEEPGDA